jgi:UDP-N-acetylmuramate dehydrogenase
MSNVKKALSDFAAIYPECKILRDEPMREHTTFRIGGTVSAVVYPCSAEELMSLCRICKENDAAYFILGNGSNLLVSDESLDIIMICTSGLNALSVSENTITVGAGVKLSKIASFALENGLGGFEFAHGIPGTLGGAVYMNAGAYGGEMKDVVTSVTAVDSDNALKTYDNAACEFSYRHSAFCDGGVVLSAKIELTPKDKSEIRGKMDELAARRKEKQPLEYPSAGSTFKRPETGFAAAMIDEAGLKGYTIGGAQVSEKHAGFVINRGGATFEDVTALMEHIQKTVFERKGVLLSPEVKIIH